MARVGKLLTPGEFYFAPLDLACRKTAVAVEALATAPAK
jgi:hypothetical protein